MKTRFALIAVAALLASTGAYAQGVINGTANGAANGAAQGSAVGGPVGGLVGGAVGAGVGAATGAVNTATGIAGAILGVDQRPRFRDYAVAQHHASYRYAEPLEIGAVLPNTGVTYYDVPADYGVRDYRYTVVNGRTVLVDPRTRRIVEVID